MNTSEPTFQISRQDFILLGVDQVAYVKPVDVEGKRAYSIHAADGTAMKLVADYETAFAAIRQHNLEPVPVH